MLSKVPLLLLFLAFPVLAEEVLPQLQIAERGKLVISEDLVRRPTDVIAKGSLTQAPSGWKFWSGEWQFGADGMTGMPKKDERRGAVAACVFHFRDAVFQFDVRLHRSRQVRFRIQDFAPEHICSVIIDAQGFAAQKDDHDHQGPDVAVPFGRVELPFPAEEWKTVVVEILGERMATTVDGHTVTGTHPLIGTPKAFFDFVVSGEGADFRRVRVWEAVPKKKATAQ